MWCKLCKITKKSGVEIKIRIANLKRDSEIISFNSF
jgi:hypothetical protein